MIHERQRGTDPVGRPNIQAAPEIRELENRAADPDGRIEAARAAVADWTGRVVLDLDAQTRLRAIAITGRCWSFVGRGCAAGRQTMAW
jgi:hypothetical protein